MGYWKYDEIDNVSRPYGKYAKYSSNEKKPQYVEGLYLGDKKSWNRLVRE